MSTVSYDGRLFRPVSNTASGEVDGDTVFHYRQSGDVVWATYEGGDVRVGTLVARVDPSGGLDMRYAHVNRRGDLMTGVCASTPEVLGDGRLRLHEQWRWTSGDGSEGTSVLDEILQTPA